MKKISLILLLVMSIFVCSCNNQESNELGKEDQQSNEIVYNDKIQNVFFGVPIGATKEEVIDGFAKYDFYEDNYSTDSRLSFEKKNGQDGLTLNSFSFGDLNWGQLYIYLKNNRFQQIEFINGFKSKDAALEDFEYVLSLLSSKYNMYEEPLDDTTSYRRFVGWTKDSQWVLVHCFSYESVSNSRWIGVCLAYGDNKYRVVSDEL